MVFTLAATPLPVTLMLDVFERCSAWPGSWHVHRKTFPLPLPRDVGQWLLEHELFSKGNDFTSPLAETPSYVGTSTLRALWAGQEALEFSTADTVRLWVLSQHGQPQGVVVWTHSSQGPAALEIHEPTSHPNHHPKRTLPTAHLGGLMVFLKAPHRGQGLVQRTLQAHVLPEVLVAARKARQGDRMPFIAASDATVCLWEGVAHVPVVPHLAMCLQARRMLWDYHQQSRMFPERPLPFREFLVPPQPLIAEPPRKRRMAIA